MIRVFIVDDHEIVRQGLSRIVEDVDDIKIVGEAADGVEAVAHINHPEWDIMLLDISMPQKSGPDVLKQIIEQKRHAKILILSMYPEDQYAVRLMRAGAAGYLTKDVAPEKLVEAIRQVFSGKKYISQQLAELLLNEMNTDVDKPLHSSLSDREFQVLRLLGSGKKVSEIAEALSLSVKTISTYRTHILEKMGLKNNSELTLYVVKNGLLK